MKKKSARANDDLNVFRSAEIKAKLNDLVALNVGKVTRQGVMIAAVEEKLKRLAAGEGQALNLVIPPSFATSADVAAQASSIVARSMAKRKRNSE